VEAIELGLCMPGLGQGHNQKKDTHTVQFDISLINLSLLLTINDIPIKFEALWKK